MEGGFGLGCCVSDMSLTGASHAGSLLAEYVGEPRAEGPVFLPKRLDLAAQVGEQLVAGGL